MPIWDQAEYESSAGKKMVTAAFTYNSKRTKTYENVEKSSYIFKPTIAYTISLVRRTCQLVESVTVRRSALQRALIRHTNPSLKRSFFQTILKPQELENAGFVFVWTENSLKTELRHDNHGAIYMPEFSPNKNPKW